MDKTHDLDRRQEYRREHDVEDREAMHDIPQRIRKATRVMILLSVCSGVVGALLGATGYRVVGPPEDVQVAKKEIEETHRQIVLLTARHDSLVAVVASLVGDAELQSYLSCMLVRRVAPDLRPKGCDAAEERIKTHGR